MVAVTATEFAKNFGLHKEQAQREPIAITSYGRISGYFVSEQEFNELQRLRKFERRVYKLKDLPDNLAKAIKGTKMNSAHNHLNKLVADDSE
jgi:PHD/YefM family antitoxin component YafN of YafNO toxin-antitoxin module